MYILGLHILDAIFILIYFIGLILIGVIVSRRIKNQEDFLMGGRKIGTLLQTFMNFGMATGSDVPVGASRETFRMGISGIWVHLFTLFATPFYWITTIWQRRLRISSMGEVFRLRYESRTMESFYAAIGIFYLIANMSLAMVTLQKTVQIVMPKEQHQLSDEEKGWIQNFHRMDQLKVTMQEREPNESERQEYEKLLALNSQGEVKSSISVINPTIFLLAISLILLFYTVAGGIIAAAITDAFQGILLIVLSVLLLPFGLIKIGGFTGLHDIVPESFFNLFGTLATSEYPWYYVASLVCVGLIVFESAPQNPQVIGSGKDEEASRVGRTNGILLKRFTIILWGFTGLVGYALYKNQISDPDMLWGFMSRQLLGPGLIGLMIICLLAALQSTASALLVSASALFTTSFYEPLFPNRSQKEYVLVSRITTVLILVAGILVTLYFQDFLKVFKLMLSIGLIFGPPFWMAIIWRKATAKAVWTAIIYSAVFTVFLGNFGTDFRLVSKSVYFCQMTNEKSVTVKIGAIQEDVENGAASKIGQLIQKEIKIEPKGVYFENIVREHADDPNSPLIGKGRFRASLYFPGLLGFDLKKFGIGDLNALGFFLDIIFPFLIIIIISYFTRKNAKEELDQFYGRLHTPVRGTPEDDAIAMELTRKNPTRFKQNKIFPNGNIELLKPTKRDTLGFLVICGIVMLFLLFLYILTQIGK
jgi:solute:Na+ symporter, SSS family